MKGNIMSDKKFTLILAVVSIVNVFAAAINIHDYYSWKTGTGKYVKEIEQSRVYFEGTKAFGSWSAEPTTPAVGFLRLRMYESDNILYISPNVITTVVRFSEYVSIVDNSLHGASTAVSTSAGHTYTVIEEADYIFETMKLLQRTVAKN